MTKTQRKICAVLWLVILLAICIGMTDKPVETLKKAAAFCVVCLTLLSALVAVYILGD